MNDSQATTTEQEGFVLGHYLLGIEGLALLRNGQFRRFQNAAERSAEIKEIVDHLDEPPYAQRRDLPKADVNEGYTSWSETYDHQGNEDPDPILSLEGPVVRSLIPDLSGVVLDAACGTGRHTGYLQSAGLDVIGVDGNAAMLEHAKEKLPGVDFRVGDLTSMPLEDASADHAVCGLAFNHLPDISPGIAELARIVKPGGLVILSTPHPFITAVVGWRAPVFDSEGNGYEMPEYEHLHGEYICAFNEHGFRVRDCHEPGLTPEHARWNPEAEEGEENPLGQAMEDALAGQPGVFVWVAERA